LAISKKLIELMHGEVHIDSEEGKGATFWFTAQFGCIPLVLRCMRAAVLPCITEKRDYCKGDPPQRCARSGREVVYLQRVAELKGQRILLAGAGDVMIPALIEQMQFWGMVVEGAIPDAEALDYMKKNQDAPFPLVIVDFMQDDVDAETLIKTIQDDARLKDTPLICLAPLSEDLRQKPWRYPDKIRYVTKPVCCSVLLDAVVRSFFILPGLPVDAPHAAAISQRSMRVLAVDDNQINRIVIAEILKNAGIECIVVESGEVAIDSVKREKFDIVLMDCQMPVMDGYEATQAIRRWEQEAARPAGIPIIALTANVTPEDVQKCFDAGMNAYCSKPVNPAMLFKEMERLLGQ
jgi:CheY-like chemotaxis protein